MMIPNALDRVKSQPCNTPVVTFLIAHSLSAALSIPGISVPAQFGSVECQTSTVVLFACQAIPGPGLLKTLAPLSRGRMLGPAPVQRTVSVSPEPRSTGGARGRRGGARKAGNMSGPGSAN